MPPESRGSPLASGLYSKSTPNLPTVQSLERLVPILRPLEPPPAQRTVDPTAAAATVAAKGSAESLTPKNPQSTARSVDDGAEIGKNEDGHLDPALNGDQDDSSSSSDAEDSDSAAGASDFTSNTNASDKVMPPPKTSARSSLVHHSRSHTYLGPAAFAPPFYNRPPTPLPPSPSLTSLLRPNFTQSSRPATPDLSSDEGAYNGFGAGRTNSADTGTTRSDALSHSSTNTTETTTTGVQTPLTAAAASTLTSSFLTAKPIPRASPKVPTYEYYGFTLYLTSGFAFVIYLLWSFLPSPLLHQFGMHYYPNRWWSLAIPAWLVVAILWIYVALAGYNTSNLTLPLDSAECIVDDAAQVAAVSDEYTSGDEDGPTARPHSGVGARHTALSRRRQQGTIKGRKRPRKSPVTPLGVDDGNDPCVMDWAVIWSEGTDAVMDIPVGGVCQVLYGSPDHDETTVLLQ